MALPESQGHRCELLAALEALEEAVFVDYGMQANPRPHTAEALWRAREVIRRTRAQTRPVENLRIVAI